MKKMKLFMLVVTAVFAGAGANAQDVAGRNFLNIGIGVGTFGFNGSGIPITASFEHGFTDKISAGAALGFVNTTYQSNYHYSYYMFGARGSYHFNELLNVQSDQFDIYGGASLFYRGYSSTQKDIWGQQYTATGGGVAFAIHAGTRYMVNETFGAYAELGYGISPLQLGVAFKF